MQAYDLLPDYQKGIIKHTAVSAAEKIINMTQEQRESLLCECYDSLEPELSVISAEVFDCPSYDEFIYRIAIEASAVDKRFTIGEKRAVKQISASLGLINRPKAKYIFKENRRNTDSDKIDLNKLYQMLEPSSREKLYTFILLVFLVDSSVSNKEFEMMRHLLTPQ